MSNKRKYVAKAFVSCSLRSEDAQFIKYVCKILHIHNIKPFGTVGRFSASPENPVELMRRNIPMADMVVICATPRYIQRDIQTGKVSYGLSEMVHVEAGMAFANNKPVVVFVKEGTNVGSFLPSITQYVELNGQRQDYLEKRRIIYSLLNNTYAIVKKAKSNNALKTVKNIAIGGLAFYGGIKLLESLFSDEDIKNFDDKKPENSNDIS